MNYLKEAFQSLNMLNEEVFDSNNLDGLKDFMDNDDSEATIDIIDVSAETKDDIKDSYIGNVILECPICKSKLFKAEDEVIIDDEEDLANTSDECPYCFSTEGFKILGKVAPYSETSVEIKDKEEDDSDDDLEESCGKKKVKDNLKFEDDEDKEELTEKENCNESFDNLHIDLDNTEIDVKEKEVPGDEMLAPLELEDKQDIENNVSEEEEEVTDEPSPEEADIDFDEVDDEFGGMVESFLKKAYDNVKSYVIESCQMKNDKMLFEGIITFEDNEKAHTSFEFVPYTCNGNKVKFLGENKSITKKNNAFILEGTVDNKKLVTESLSYKYNSKDNEKLVKVAGKITK